MADTNWLSSLNATVLQNYIPILQDNVFQSNPVLQKLQANKGLLSTIKPEGQNLLVPIIVGKNDTATSYSGYDKLPVGPQKGFIDASIGYASYNVSVTISSEEEKRAAGNKTKMVSLLNGRMMQAENSLYELLTQDLFLDGTGNGGKALTGFLAMIPTTAAVTTSYMGIASNAAWAHKYKTAGLATLLADMEKLFRSCKDGMDKTDLILTSDLGEEIYGTKLGSGGYSVAYAQNTNMDFGPVSYSFKQIPIVTDKAHPDYTANTYPIYHFLNTKYLGFMWANWQVGEYLKPIDQHAKTSLISVDTQLITNNRRRQGKLVVTGA